MSAEDNLRQYFRTIWKDTPGVVYLPSRGENKNDWKQTLFNWPSQEDRIVEMVQARQDSREIFVNPVVYKDNGVRDKSTISRHNFHGSWVLWADFDGNAPETWNAELPEPSLKIQTSTKGHQHTYWVLDEFLQDPTVLEDKNRALAHQLHADVSGWDVSQLLRPPSTINHKYGKDEYRGKKYDVTIEESSDRVYPSSFVQRESIYRPVVTSELIGQEIPSIRTVLAEGKWKREFLNLLEKSEPSDRSGALMALAFYAAEAGFNDTAIYSVVEDADSRWGKYRDRSDRVRRLVDIVDKARRKYPYGIAQTDFGDVFGDITEVENAPKIVWNFQEFMDADFHISWVLDNLFPRKGYGIIYGMPGVGKTLLGMDLAFCLAFGSDWMIWKNSAGPQNVLFLSLEMNHVTLQLQYSKMIASFSPIQLKELQEHLFIAPLAETIPLDTQEGRAKVEGFLMQYRPDVLYIDSLSESSYKSLLDDEGVRDMNRYFRYIREKYNCSLYVVHHDRKSGATKHQDLDSMWGSRFISSAADFILFLQNTEPKSDQILCIHDKNRLGVTEQNFMIDRDWHTFSFSYSDPNNTSDRTERINNGILTRLNARESDGITENPLDLFGDTPGSY